MIRFECDYSEGAHEAILQRLIATNMEQTVGYSEDPYCESAREKIRAACDCPEAAVHFLVGGTQTNATVISSVLRPHQGVLCAQSGHINVHETGAIEALGHKVLALPQKDGKITAQQVREYTLAHYADSAFEHTVQPGMVYISHPTEMGTLYTLEEMTELSRVCRELGLPLFADGARLGYGLAAGEVTLRDMAKLCDVFYIGGTKCGALFGEAVVISSPALQKDFRYHIKQNGGMLAKGRLLGVQFDTLFTDGLYEKITGNASRQALRIRAAFEKKGIEMFFDSTTNQQFPVLTGQQMDALKEDFSFTYWQKVDENRHAVRFCTSWATKDEHVEKLVAAIEAL
ncbi:MAG: low specificity L-threonine aldolase [Clostridia bacterium]|nr:low specificity L-threonine aldolase [Clostridia bacterium]